MIDCNIKAWKYIYSVNEEANRDRNRIALTDGVKSISYKQMFMLWQNYASVFSALNMTGQNKARVGMLGTTSPEVVIAFYGLNIVGAEVSMFSALCALKLSKLESVIREEGLTDLILTDDIISEKLVTELLSKKSELSLRHIIILPTPVGGSTLPMPVYMSGESKAAALRQRFPMLYMDMLLILYGNAPIKYADSSIADTSIIMHTSGTTSGAGKPVVLTDTSFNAICESVGTISDYDELKTNLVSPLIVDLSNVFGLVVQVHAMMSMGATIVTVPYNALNPFMYKAIPAHNISLMFVLGAMVDMWMKLPLKEKMDFSSVRMIIIGGSYVSAEDKKRYYRFFADHGAKDFCILNGYGISEAGGVCTLSTPNPDDESIGYALPGCELKFYDEDKEKYFSLKDAPCTGVMYINSRAMAKEGLDGNKTIKYEIIDGRPYICTNDLIQADASGKLVYLGRANRYFLNESGEKYQSGMVETAFSGEEGIVSCAIVPVYEKVGHDNIPMLCVQVLPDAKDPIGIIKNALTDIFIVKKKLTEKNIPMIVLIAEDLPHNGNGKVDLYKINKGQVIGQKYNIRPVKNGEKLSGFNFTVFKDSDDNMISSVYKSIAKDIMGNAVSLPHYVKRPYNNQWQMCMNIMKQNLNMMQCMNMMTKQLSDRLDDMLKS